MMRPNHIETSPTSKKFFSDAPFLTTLLAPWLLFTCGLKALPNCLIHSQKCWERVEVDSNDCRICFHLLLLTKESAWYWSPSSNSHCHIPKSGWCPSFEESFVKQPDWNFSMCKSGVARQSTSVESGFSTEFQFPTNSVCCRSVNCLFIALNVFEDAGTAHFLRPKCLGLVFVKPFSVFLYNQGCKISWLAAYSK